MNATFDVSEISVHVATGEAADDPYRQGFAATSAVFEAVDGAVIERLVHIAGERTSVTVRCAMITVSGTVTKTEPVGRGMRFTLMVDDLVYRKPSGPVIRRRKKASA